VQVVDRIEHRVRRLRPHQKRDHAGAEVEIGQQHVLRRMPPQFDGDMACQRGGAAAALGRKESRRLALAPESGARLAALGRLPLQRRAQVGPERRKDVFVGAGAQRRENLFRLGAGVEHDHHRARRNGFHIAHHVVESRHPGDVDQQHVRMDALYRRQHRRRLLFVKHNPHRQIPQAGLRLLAQLPRFDRDADGQRKQFDASGNIISAVPRERPETGRN
jgi:hypothetical protein